MGGEGLPLQMEMSYKQGKCSNSADLPSSQNHKGTSFGDFQNQCMSGINNSLSIKSKFNGIKTKEKEKEHFTFLNEMRVRLGVDSQKLIDLEARISCKFSYLILK